MPTIGRRPFELRSGLVGWLLRRCGSVVPCEIAGRSHRYPNVCVKLLVMVSDELRIERLAAPERLAVAVITGTVENCTLHHGRAVDEAHDAVRTELARLRPDRWRLVLAHCAAAYVGGEYAYQAASVTLLEQVALPVTMLGDTQRRKRLLAIQSQRGRRQRR